MVLVGQSFEEGESFVPELILSGEVLRQISQKLKPLMSDGVAARKLGKVVLGTVQGDIHNIGKDIVAFLLDVNGFDVTDLGVDVLAGHVRRGNRSHRGHRCGIERASNAGLRSDEGHGGSLREAGLASVKVMIGGSQVDEQIRAYTGADAYGQDAVAAVTLAKQWIGA